MALRLAKRATIAISKSLTQPVYVRGLSSYSNQSNKQRKQRENEQSNREHRWSGRWLAGLGLLLGASGMGAVAAAAAPSSSPTKADYDKVKKAIQDILDDPDYDDGSLGPLFVRLAWHAAGTFDKYSQTGGSNGSTIRLSPEADHGANKGLHIARQRLESVKQNFPFISYADLYTLSGAVAIEALGGPNIPWRPGRSDVNDASKCPPDGRLPDASKGSLHIRTIFYRMGLNDQEIVALIGAHSLGRMHTDRSGFEGPWTNAPTTFSNEFFRLLLEEQWTPRKWNGPKQFTDKSGTLTMLPADLAFVIDVDFRKYVEIYAKDEQKFFNDFAQAFSKLLELGVPNGHLRNL